MANKLPVKARFAAGSPVDVVALQEFEPTDTISLSLISGFAAGVTAELANNSISTLSDVDTSGSPAPANGEVLAWNSISGMWEPTLSPGSSAAIWGNISGTLSDQTDLQAALDLKADQTDLDAHTGDATIHFTEASIDHTAILNIGINSHTDIDTHIGDSTIHFSTLDGLSDVVYTGSPAPLDGQVLTWNNIGGYWEPATPTDNDVSAVWGNITGTLSNQTDLQAALDLKADQTDLDVHTGDATIHYTQSSISITESQISDLQPYLLDITAESIDDLLDVVVPTPAIGQVLTYEGSPPMWVASTPLPGVTDHTLLTNIGINSHTDIDTHIGDATLHFTEASIDHTAILNIGINSHTDIDTHIAGTALQHSATDIIFDDTFIGNGNINVQTAIDGTYAEALHRMHWAGHWNATSTYGLNDVVRDENWTLVRVAETGSPVNQDRPKPIPLGNEEFGYPIDPAWSQTANTSNIRCIQKYTTGLDFWVPYLRLWVDVVGTTINHRMYVNDITDPLNPNFFELGLPELVANEWNNVPLDDILFPPGTVVELIYDTWNSATDSTFTSQWTKLPFSTSSIPAAGEWWVNSSRNLFRVNILDDGGIDRSATLLAAGINTAWDVSVASQPTTGGEYLQTGNISQITDYVEFSVSLNTGRSAINDFVLTDIRIDVPVSSSATFVSQAAYWNVGSTPDILTSVTSRLEYDGVDQAIDNTTAMPLDFRFQRALVNTDWETMAVSITSSMLLDIAGKEDALGNPTVDGYVLSSTIAGVRSWIPSGGGGLDELVKVSAADTTAGYLSTELVAGSGIGLNIQNPAADEKLEIVSDVFVVTIGGNPIPAFIDTLRGNKTLSVETTDYSWGEATVSNFDWIRLSGASDAQSGYVVPFNGTIVSSVIQCENTNGNTKDINLYVNGVNSGSVGQLTGAGEQFITDTTLNIDITANDKLRLRGGSTGGTIQDTNIQLRVKWRL